MEIVLQQKQTLNLVMTTELRQAITLLQYPTYELYQFIQEQEMENPLIELEERMGTDLSNRGSTRVSSEGSHENPIDFIACDEKGMRDHFIEQVNWLDLGEEDRKIVHYLILNLDENGYLPLKVENIKTHLQIDDKKAEKCITLLQQLEPAGVGARNLKECLLLQLRRYYPEEETTEIIIKNYLDLLANKKWKNISKEMNISLSKVKESHDLILSLNPNPCTQISDEDTEYLNPDIIVENEDDKFLVYLNDNYIPKINVNKHYLNLLKGNEVNKKYLQEHISKYQWLVNSIEQRRSTILKITEVVIKKQKEFLRKGFSALQPLTLKEVADEIEMHESTVSRATMNKVIQTPLGSFEFRKLFTTKLKTTDGVAMSQARVKILLEDIVKKENKYKPLSDQKIADLLKVDKGITVSRRTVAKYRKELNILSSNKRKEIKVS